MMGRPAEEVLGHGLLELFPSHLELGYFEQYAQAVETGQRCDVEITDFDENGVRGSFLVKVWKYGDGYIMLGHDITNRLQQQRALALSESRYRLLAENASDVVCLMHGDGVLEWVSPSVATVLGWDPDGLVGARQWDLVHPDDRQAAMVMLAESAATGFAPKGLEVRLRRDDGSYQWMAARGRPVLTDGEVGRLVVSLTDVDEQVRERLALKESEARYRALAERATAFAAQVDDPAETW